MAAASIRASAGGGAEARRYSREPRCIPRPHRLARSRAPPRSQQVRSPDWYWLSTVLASVQTSLPSQRCRGRGRERARAVPEEEPGREREREREREGGAVRERRDRSRGAASDAAREADRWACCFEVDEERCRPAYAWALRLSLKPCNRRERGRGGSPPARERMRRVALATEVLRIANGGAGPRADHQPVAAHGASR